MINTRIALVLTLLELNDKVGCFVSRALVALLFEYERRALRVSRLNFDLLHGTDFPESFSIVIDDFPVKINLFYRAVVKLL